jgi:hypothetical protein
MVWFMVFNATFNNISVISWLSVLLVEESEVPLNPISFDSWEGRDRMAVGFTTT